MPHSAKQGQSRSLFRSTRLPQSLLAGGYELGAVKPAHSVRGMYQRVLTRGGANLLKSRAWPTPISVASKDFLWCAL
jgi:hypothetical protein